MDETIRKIYELMHSPIITPYNLLKNVKLDNYSYVNYYKGELGLITEMACSMDDGVEAIFYYHFDEKDRLMKIYQEIKGEQNIVFDRDEALENIEKELG